jgi:formyltetrahydrofolate-dependent phosphoribosylglycinamide formyltransferase
MSVSVAVFASGGGSNFQSLLDHQTEDSPGRIELLISDRPDAGALQRAEKAGISTQVIPVKGRSHDGVGLETLEVLEQKEIHVVLMAGYLRLLPPVIIQAYPKLILNIHPALLPSFGGEGMWGHFVHEAVLASGASFSGPTIHFVDEDYDTGTILAQWPVPVLSGDTPESLAARVLKVEHILYPRAADHLCRAVDQGRQAAPLSLPEEAALYSGSYSADTLAAQIDAAFLASNGPSEPS